MIKKLMKKFKIKHIFSTSYHSKTNGLVERFNKTLCESLVKLKKDQNWDRKIAPVLFAYRNKRQESTKIKPFYLTYGRETRLPTDTMDNNLYNQDQRTTQLFDDLPKI
jgi:transposase InsO family protein